MRKVFWDNPYQTRLNTQVEQVMGNEILLRETIAFSFCGGQESDKATLNGFAILTSRIEADLIYYTLPENHGFKQGDSVLMEIDWQRRYRLMRLHFAAELMLEIVVKNYHLKKIGAHIAESKARIDFEYPGNIATYFDTLLAEYNTLILSDYPIITGFSDIVTQRRYWEIEGLSRVSCGGTHVKSTREVGQVSLKRKNIGHAKERIEIMLIQA